MFSWQLFCSFLSRIQIQTASTLHQQLSYHNDKPINPFGHIYYTTLNKGNNKITELRTILQRESQNS
jgi:hypothetical protein